MSSVPPSTASSPDLDPGPRADQARMGLAAVLGLLAGFAAVGSSGAAVVLPSLAEAMDVTTSTSAWVISGFSLAYGVAMAVHGRLADLFGLRVPLTTGVVLMALGAVVAGSAASFEVLMVGRILQGLGGAAIPVLGMAVVSARYTGVPRVRALGLATGLSAAGACIGPLVGGVLDALLSWRAAIALPALGLALVPLAWRSIPTVGSRHRLDLVGAALVAATATGVVLLIQSVSTGGAVAVAGAALLTVGLSGATLWIRRVPEGFLPRAVITDGTVVRAAAAATAVPVAWFALLVAVPLTLSAHGWSPLQIGLALLPSVVCGLAAPRLTAPLLAAFGHARALTGAGVTAAAALLLASAGAAADIPALLVLGVMMVTTAFGLCQPAMVGAITAAVQPEVRGVALGIAIMTFFVAGGVGSAVIGGFSDAVGIPAALAYLSAGCLLAASLVWPRTRRTRPDVTTP